MGVYSDAALDRLIRLNHKRAVAKSKQGDPYSIEFVRKLREYERMPGNQKAKIELENILSVWLGKHGAR